MDAPTVLRQARQMAGLSKRALARRAGTSPAAIVMYETGARDPGVSTLLRLLAAAGYRGELRVRPTSRQPDPAVNGIRLAQVLDLADRLPRRPARKRLAYPLFGPPSGPPPGPPFGT